MYLREPKSFLFNGIIILLFCCAIFTADAEGVESPVSPIVYGDGSGGLELYWFQPGRYLKNIGNNTIIPERGVIPSKDDRQHCIFTTIDLTPPVLYPKCEYIYSQWQYVCWSPGRSIFTNKVRG